MFAHSKLLLKLCGSIISLILFVETILLFISYEKKHETLLEMQQYEKNLYGRNLIYSNTYINDHLHIYSVNIILYSLLISVIVSVSFTFIYHYYVGRYLRKISRLNHETSPLKTKSAFKKIPDDEIGDVINSRIEMLTRIDVVIANNKKLLRTLSHDLANLLMISDTSISGIKKLLNTEDTKLKKYLDKLEFASKRQKDLIEKVRHFDASKDKLGAAEIKAYNLSEILNESLIVFEDRLNTKRISVHLDDSSNVNSYIYVDRILFFNNVLNNLISNAIKFSENDSEILLTVSEGDRGLILTIKDNGIGIPENILKNLFSGGINNSRTGLNGEVGTGFGMGLLKSTLDLFNCKIKVESHERTTNQREHGTKITISFPCKIDKEAP